MVLSAGASTAALVLVVVLLMDSLSAAMDAGVTLSSTRILLFVVVTMGNVDSF